MTAIVIFLETNHLPHDKDIKKLVNDNTNWVIFPPQDLPSRRH